MGDKSSTIQIGTNHVTQLILYSVIALFFYTTVSISPGFKQRLEALLDDFLYGFRPKVTSSEKIVLIQVDDYTAEEYGNPPSRQHYADILTRMQDAPPTAVAFDIVFENPSRDSAADHSFAQAVSALGNVVIPRAPDFYEAGEEESEWDEGIEHILQIIESHTRAYPHSSLDPPRIEDVTLIYRQLEMAVRKGAHIAALPDLDGVFRQQPLFAKFRGKYLPAMGLQMAQVYFDSEVMVEGDEVFIQKGEERHVIRTDKQGYYKLNFNLPYYENFVKYSLRDVLEDSIPYETFKDKLVFVGNGASGADQRPVVGESAYLMLGLHMNMTNTIIQNYSLGYASSHLTYGVVILLFLVPLIIAYLVENPFKFSIYYGIWMFLVFLMLIVMVAASGIFINVYVSFFATLLGSVAILVKKGYDEFKKSLELEGLFGAYVSPQLLKQISQDKSIDFKPVRKKVTVLFSDIVAFSTYTDVVEADVLVQFINEYYIAMTQIIEKHGGIINKFIGDGLLVLFGDLITRENPPQDAVNAALEMQQKVTEMSNQRKTAGKNEFQIRVGIDTGDVTIGNMGSAQRKEYAVLGRHVNMAARLEGKCSPGKVLISQRTQSQLVAKYVYEDRGTIELKGTREPQQVYEISLAE